MNENTFYLDRNYIIATAKFKFGSVKTFCKSIKISRVRFYEVIKTGYKRKDAPIVIKFIQTLDLDSSLMWEE